ncbi:hypothetical protein [Roseovarius atlanticus]|uniref:hypothetical protein n=1 Tax=Roseovarius atlanticus TaxID=1641875 RepID=UPI001C976086|nr:hypothetical protein [Roseovarius atlanticus]MBY5988210.1 hypothetical protein [Roseovarius atlanticus]MBY6123601.1 hypothetical protein [Roseovarius atlanticus]MBY6148096.1 hypothetical protein [Roseovarius atlanticus]
MLQRLAILAGRFGSFWHGSSADLRARRDAAYERALRWRKAFAADPQLRADLVELGDLLQASAKRPTQAGDMLPGTKDLYQCGVDEGRRSLALEVLALGGLDEEEMVQLMEEPDDV